MNQTTTVPFALRSAAAGTVVLLGPVLAWLLCISWRVDAASDAQHVLWFVTTAVLCLVAGAVAPFRPWLLALLSVGAVVSTMTTLYAWWSATDITGLFLVGILMATPLVVVAAPLLLLIGGALRGLPERDGRRLTGA